MMQSCGRLMKFSYGGTTITTRRQFDRELAEQFDVENRLIVEDGYTKYD